MNEDLHEKLEQYLAGTLSSEDISALEKEISTNPELAEQLRLQFQAQIAVEQAGDDELKNLLNKRGQGHFEENYEKDTVIRKNLFSRPGTWLAIAAAIVLLISLAVLLNSSPPNLPDLYAQNYQELSFPAERGADPLVDSISLWRTIQISYDAQNYTEALKGLNQYIDQGGEGFDAQAYLYKGICLLKLQEPLEAVKAFEQVPAAHGDTQRASWYRALAFLQADELSEAQTALKEIAENEAHYKRKQARELLEMLE